MDVIFAGVVTHVRLAGSLVFTDAAARTINLRSDSIATQFEVETEWKGQVGDWVELLHGNEEASCGINFDVGQRTMVLAKRTRNRQLETSLCLMAGAPDNGEERQAVLPALEGYRQRWSALIADSEARANDAEAHLGLADFLEEWHDLDGAAKAFHAASRAAPNDLRALVGQGRVLVAQKRYAEAVEPLSRAAELFPSDKEVAQLLKQARAWVKRLARPAPSRPSEFEQTLDVTCSELGPDDPRRESLGYAPIRSEKGLPYPRIVLCADNPAE